MEPYQVNATPAITADRVPPGELKPVTRDEVQLARFGKKQQLNRNFRFLSILALTCTVLITWEGFLTTFVIGLTNGGPAGVVYGYLFAWVGNILQVLVMAEMVSMIPIAGGQYNWVSALAPRSSSKFLSYIAGWMTFISWQAVLASTAYLAGTMIQNVIILNYVNYTPQLWHGTLLFYAVIVLALTINTWLARILPEIESAVFVIHVLGFFCIIIPLLYLAPHASADEVFALFMNNAGWETDGLTFFVSLTGAMFAFGGIDAAGHMAEEVRSASYVVPTSMIASIIINGLLGFGTMLALLFCIGDVNTVLESQSQYPFIDVFVAATKSTGGATAMISVVTAMVIFANIGALATASRMTWAFARERGLPFHKFLSRVEPRTRLPLYAISLSATISLLLALINIGSAAAFNALVSLAVASVYASFLLSACVLLHKRLTVADEDILWGQFTLGRAGTPLTVLAIMYTIIGMFFSFWPVVPNPTLGQMNWSALVFGFSVIFSVSYWALWGRKTYNGPIREVILENEQPYQATQ